MSLCAHFRSTHSFTKLAFVRPPLVLVDPMSSVPQLLRETREERKLTVHQVAEATKLRTDHVRALEEGNYDVFAAPVYIKGFVRTYAGLLKLDVPMVMAALDAELSHSAKHHENPPLDPTNHGFLDKVMYQLSKLNWRVVLPISVLIAVAGLGIWGFRFYVTQKNKDPLANLGSGVYKPATNTLPQTLPLPVPK
ncbi:MAG: putative transcriptional regulator [Verrucomicrobiales bacterium]|nr:putative transcriptional regulator [Verrucomicrobiales bacterium]